MQNQVRWPLQSSNKLLEKYQPMVTVWIRLLDIIIIRLSLQINFNKIIRIENR